MIVPDTSVWVDYLRGRDTPARRAMRALVQDGKRMAITEVIVMEVLGGVPGAHLAQVRADLLALPMLRLEGLADFEAAAAIYRGCRTAGESLRGFIDCLIAVPAIRTGASILHTDRDFDVIARHTPLRIEPVDG